MSRRLLNRCRFCDKPLGQPFLDLGCTPLANSYLKKEHLNGSEPRYPLQVYFCESCHLVQLPNLISPEEIFTNYFYFSSYSESWLHHARSYADYMVERFGFDHSSQVIEIASNDGYLLQYFTEKGIPVLGVEPAENVAAVAEERGIPTLVDFFGRDSALSLVRKGQKADLIVGNNVIAHVPHLNDFIAGMTFLLKPDGIITMEFPHLLRLLEDNQFDTIYHEHFSYFSFTVAEKVFERHGFILFDVEELPTHGGSLRIFACHKENRRQPVTSRVLKLKKREEQAGLNRLATYLGFDKRVRETKRKLLDFLNDVKSRNESVVGYGAPAKGNTLLNYCGIGPSLIEYTVDRSPYKQGTYLPGSHLPVYYPDKIRETKPDWILILPWNIKDEIMRQMDCIRDWEGRFVVPIPEMTVCK